jgi:hypothetical protein
MKKSRGFRFGERAGQKKRTTVPNPPCRKNSVQVFSCVHAEVSWSSVVHEPHLCNELHKRVRWAGHVTCTGELKIHTEFWFGSIREECIYENTVVGSGLYSAGSRWCPIAGFCEHDNEPSVFLISGKCGYCDNI